MPKLYIAATPIGNLQDGSPRLKQTLESCGVVLCEDTRVTMKLFAAYQIKPGKLLSSHQFNERARASQIIRQMLAEDVDVALVTDAGTPCISDPGYEIVKAAVEEGIEVLPIPGPSAVTAALSISGFAIESYAFFGFLPRGGKQRSEAFARIRGSGIQIAVVYESPHRVKALIEDVGRFLPGAMLSLSCDLTKLYEKTIRGSAADVLQALNANSNAEKGEYVLVIDLHDLTQAEAAPVVSTRALLLDLVLSGVPMRDAMQQIAQEHARPRNEIYKASLSITQFISEENHEQE